MNLNILLALAGLICLSTDVEAGLRSITIWVNDESHGTELYGQEVNRDVFEKLLVNKRIVKKPKSLQNSYEFLSLLGGQCDIQLKCGCDNPPPTTTPDTTTTTQSTTTTRSKLSTTTPKITIPETTSTTQSTTTTRSRLSTTTPKITIPETTTTTQSTTTTRSRLSTTTPKITTPETTTTRSTTTPTKTSIKSSTPGRRYLPITFPPARTQEPWTGTYKPVTYGTFKYRFSLQPIGIRREYTTRSFTRRPPTTRGPYDGYYQFYDGLNYPGETLVAPKTST